MAPLGLGRGGVGFSIRGLRMLYMIDAAHVAPCVVGGMVLASRLDG